MGNGQNTVQQWRAYNISSTSTTLQSITNASHIERIQSKPNHSSPPCANFSGRIHVRFLQYYNATLKMPYSCQIDAARRLRQTRADAAAVITAVGRGFQGRGEARQLRVDRHNRAAERIQAHLRGRITRRLVLDARAPSCPSTSNVLCRQGSHRRIFISRTVPSSWVRGGGFLLYHSRQSTRGLPGSLPGLFQFTFEPPIF